VSTDDPPCWDIAKGVVRLRVRVQPRSSRNRVAGLHGGRLKVQVDAPPADGAANRAMVAVLSAWLGIAKRDLEIVRGETSREKVVALSGMPPREVAERLRSRLATLR
jgi:uncharacterized protein (TIGR00251 family)